MSVASRSVGRRLSNATICMRERPDAMARPNSKKWGTAQSGLREMRGDRKEADKAAAQKRTEAMGHFPAVFAYMKEVFVKQFCYSPRRHPTTSWTWPRHDTTRVVHFTNNQLDYRPMVALKEDRHAVCSLADLEISRF